MIMPHPSKKQRLTVMETDLAEATVADDQMVATASDVSIDVLADIFGFLGIQDIMNARVCKIWKEAVKKTIVPPIDFWVESLEEYNAMRVMTKALPNCSRLNSVTSVMNTNTTMGRIQMKRRLLELPTTHDVEIISAFRKLRSLEIDTAPLNGRYPFLFNSFPLLQKLTTQYCYNLKWDLEMLSGLPLLKDLVCGQNRCLTGNISSLRMIKDTLEKVYIEGCENVEGNFMDLADFPDLKVLKLFGTAVTGDIRDINANDFSALESLDIPKGVYGGRGYELQSISDGPDLMRTLYVFNKQRPNLIDSLLPTLSGISTLIWKLVEDSPDWYEPAFEDDDDTPFLIKFVKAGSRLGYRWESYFGDNPCEVNSLDPEPDRENTDYDEYIEELKEINSDVRMFRGFLQPPSEEEYNRLCEEYNVVLVSLEMPIVNVALSQA
jgi:hypothetical protein